MPKHISMEDFEADMTKLSSGWKKHLPADLREIYVAGKRFTRAEMGQVIQLILSSLKDVKTTLRAHHAAVQFRDQRLPDWFKLQEAVNAVILQRIGNRPLLLAEFGLAPKGERAQPSAEDKAIAAELRRRTRQVRGTMSKKQRLKITTRPEPTIQVLGPNGKPLLAPKLTPASPKLLGPHKPPKK